MPESARRPADAPLAQRAGGGRGRDGGGPRDPLPVAPSRDEIRAMLKAIHGRHAVRDRTMVLVAFDAACRVSELVGMTVGGVDFAEGTVRFNRPKTGDEHLVGLGEASLDAIRRYLMERRRTEERMEIPPWEPLFVSRNGSAMTTANFRRICRKAARDAGIATYQTQVGYDYVDPRDGKTKRGYRPAKPGETPQVRSKARCHGLRHAKAIAIVRDGGTEFDVADHLGHKSMDSSRAYLRLGDKEKHERQRKLGSL